MHVRSQYAGTAITIISFQATDRDIGDNARISYRFKDTSDSITTPEGDVYLLTDLFSIDEATGEISLILEGVLDAETNKNPGKITVEASDNGTPSRNTTTILKVNIPKCAINI